MEMTFSGSAGREQSGNNIANANYLQQIQLMRTAPCWKHRSMFAKNASRGGWTPMTSQENVARIDDQNRRSE
jgi:hypothetical protein